jgi:hypothetical protein
MSDRAKGSFEVKVVPVIDVEDTVASGRLRLDKTYRGDLTGTGRGEMWSVDTGVQGSGGYVAIERITGSLAGREGSFVLLHQGTMSRGADFRMRLVVVPESGTNQLEGLNGTMTIIIEGKQHFYELDYTLSELPAKR